MTLPYGYVTADQVSGGKTAQEDFKEGDPAQEVDPRRITVVGSDGWGTTGGRAQAELIAFDSTNSVLYYNTTHDGYLDVDPVPNTTYTISYVAHETLPPRSCDQSRCTEVLIEQTNISTGRTDVLYSTKTPGIAGTRWHDVDRLSKNAYVVADIHRDRVFILNTSTNTVEWSWSLKNQYNISASGGKWPSDWTHLNDVEILPPSAKPDARFMISVRNHDSVIFVNRDGLVANWTLGSDDLHGTLYEQHNPDYIPSSRGGPAILVADSQNNRVVEYQRQNGSWMRSWRWRDSQLRWPRDADRLPNGHTLVTDSNGNRVLEVDECGNVVESVSIGLPYEAERLGTGDESAGGKSAVALQLESRMETTYPSGSRLRDGSIDPIKILFRFIFSITPSKIVNAAIFVLPRWIDPLQIVAAVASSGVGTIWLITEYRWQTFKLRSPILWQPD
jgi:hypothetical protein